MSNQGVKKVAHGVILFKFVASQGKTKSEASSLRELGILRAFMHESGKYRGRTI
jgi:hypothetical protein